MAPRLACLALLLLLQPAAAAEPGRPVHREQPALAERPVHRGRVRFGARFGAWFCVRQCGGDPAQLGADLGSAQQVPDLLAQRELCVGQSEVHRQLPDRTVVRSATRCSSAASSPATGGRSSV